MMRELLEIARERKWLWFIPLIVIALALGIVLLFGTQRGISPFIYNRF